jgi:hypothetical protein
VPRRALRETGRRGRWRGERRASSPQGVTTARTGGSEARGAVVPCGWAMFRRESVLGDVGGRKGAGAPG